MLSNHYKNKYIRLKVNDSSLKLLQEDIKDLTEVKEKSSEHIAALNWLKDLELRTRGVLKFGMELRRL